MKKSSLKKTVITIKYLNMMRNGTNVKMIKILYHKKLDKKDDKPKKNNVRRKKLELT